MSITKNGGFLLQKLDKEVVIDKLDFDKEIRIYLTDDDVTLDFYLSIEETKELIEYLNSQLK